LTEDLIDYIEAPMPYIIGIPRIIWKIIKQDESKIKQINSEAAIFDLNKNKIKFQEIVPDFPIKEIQPIITILQEINTKRMGFCQKNLNEQTDFWQIYSLKLKENFFILYIKLLNGYLKFFTKNNENNLIFDYQKYEGSLEINKKPFLTQFIKTHNFTNFIEKTAESVQQKNEISFFVEGEKIYQNSGEKALDVEISKISQRLLYNYKNVFFEGIFYMKKAYNCKII